ncbi:O112ac family O-antigen polymerase [Edwardsiella tarda]
MKIKKARPLYLSVLFLCSGCGLYVYNFFPAPYYVFIIFSIVFFLCAKKITLRRSTIFFIIINIFLFSYLFVYSNLNVWSYYFVGIIGFLFVIAVGGNLTEVERDKIIRYTVYLSLCAVVYDTIYRYVYPSQDYISVVTAAGRDDLIFYAYKYSLLFQDSNFVGLFLISIYFLVRENKVIFKHYYLLVFIIFALTVLTISRAAIAALIFVEAIRTFFGTKISIHAKITLIILSMLPFLYLLIDVSEQFNDASFESKFYLMHKFYTTMINRDVIELLFGWGLDKTREHWDIAAHSFFNTLILETGVVGFLIILSTFIYALLLNRKVKYHFLAIAITSLSFGLVFSPFVIPMALNVISLNNRNENRV